MPILRLTINGKAYEVDASEQTPLLEVLRDSLGLTGTKYGCGEGQCGACTVLVDGKAVKACLSTGSMAAGKAIETIEGLAGGDRLHPLQEAFLEHAAFQCGFCTPGMILASKALLAEAPAPSPQQIREGLEGHICRCGTYPRIVEAVLAASKKLLAGDRPAGGKRDA